MSEDSASIESSGYLSDDTLTDPDNDIFNRWPFAQRIAQTIISRKDSSSLVISIYGKWGSGKTTVLNFIKKELQQDVNTIFFEFNPWLVNDENKLIISFFFTLAESLKKSLTTRKENISKLVAKYAAFAAPLSVGLGPLSLSPKEIVKIGNTISMVDIEEYKERVENILKEGNKKVVVFMDDIDRLDNSEIYAVFKLIKLTADFKHTTYVLAFDDEMVADALKERYAGKEEDAGHNFLEKIIQVPLNLPKPDPISLRHLCFLGVDNALNSAEIQLSEDQAREFARHFMDGLEIRLKTPRMCKRYANALLFALPILKEELNVVDLMLIEGLRIFYPKLYQCVRDNPQVFAGTSSDKKIEKEASETLLESILKSLSKEEVDSVLDLLKNLFPKIRDTVYGPGWEDEWAEKQKVASKDYFDRYFAYSLVEGDISDVSVNEFISAIKDKTVNEVAENLKQFLNDRNAERVVYKLRRNQNKLSEKESEILSKALAASGSLFPNPDSLIPFLNPWFQVAFFISQLLLNIDKEGRRFQAAKEIIENAVPLSFAVECFQSMRFSDSEEEEERKLSKEEENELGKILSDLIKTEAHQQLLYLKYPEESNKMLWIWSNWIGKEEVTKYLRDSFNAYDQNIVEFLKNFIPTSWGMSDLPRKGEFERHHFDFLAKIIDPHFVYSKLKEIYGPELDEAKSTMHYLHDPLERKVAFQFASIFHHVQKEKEEKERDSENVEQNTQK